VRILLVKLGSIGDIVHTLPSLAAIKKAMPEAEVSWVVEERSAEILRGNPLIDNLVEIDTRRLRRVRGLDDAARSAQRQLRHLRQLNADVAVDFQGLMKSGLVSRLSGARVRFGFSRDGLREGTAGIFYTRSVVAPAGVNVIRKNLALSASALKIAVPDSGFDFPIAVSPEHRAEAGGIIDQAGGNFAILNPGGGWVTKLWPADKFGRLADRLWEELHLVPLITTGPGEDGLAKAAAEASSTGKLLAVTPSLKGFLELARKASVYIGGDTGPTHLAIAARAPVVGLFGPTEWWRNGSTAPDDICVERTDIGCRVDCHRRTCSKWICMDSDVDTVFAAVNKRLGNG